MHMMQSAWRLDKKEKRIWTAAPYSLTIRYVAAADSFDRIVCLKILFVVHGAQALASGSLHSASAGHKLPSTLCCCMYT